ncbi:MAG TPA: GNAT family protein [Synergistaceae bacterium]|nr:GNAT family protein [Synergistaceae bacterium]HPQ38341.1 GNAT family protein [Synergistaceae bacterium]
MKEKTPSFPVLQTPRLVLSELDESHAETLHKIWTDPRVLEYLVLDPFTELEQTREMISLLQGLHASGEGIRWGLIRESDGNILGTCGFHKWDREHHRVEIGYELTSDAWRHGFMSEAVRGALQYGFTEMDCNRVEALVTVGNKASSGFLKKNGFTLEGTLRQYEWARGKFQDQWMFSLLREEWQKAR